MAGVEPPASPQKVAAFAFMGNRPCRQTMQIGQTPLRISHSTFSVGNGGSALCEVLTCFTKR